MSSIEDNKLSNLTLSIVTPSYNQGNFINETIESVLGQNYPNLEYIIIDGNSTDKSIDIIKKHEKDLKYWVSEPDAGQYDAINKGFEHSTGEIMAWINSDDKYTPWSFSVVTEIFEKFPEIEWLTSANGLHWDSRGRAVNCGSSKGFNSKAFFRGANLPERPWHATGWIQQESTFWRRSLWERVDGRIDSSLEMAGDFDLWANFFSEAKLYSVTCPLGGFRIHGNQKTVNKDLYFKEAEKILKEYGGKTYGKAETSIRNLLFNLTGRQAIPKDKLPDKLSPIIEKLPLFYKVKQCTWISEEWEIIDSFMV